MEKIQCVTTISRYEYLIVDSRRRAEEMIKHKMAYDIAMEILKKIDVEEDSKINDDHVFRLSFWTTTSNKEVAAVDKIMKILEAGREIKSDSNV